MIKVTGTGKLAIAPDLIRIRADIEGEEKEYEAAVRASAQATAEVKTALEALGFDKSEVKTLHYDVQTEYENYQNRQRAWRRRFKGYKYCHRIKFEFTKDNELLGKVLHAIAHCEAKPEFSIEYSVYDKEAAKDELLKKAIADSKRKAEILAQSAGMVLGELQTINYSWGEIDLISRPFGRVLNYEEYDEDCDYEDEYCRAETPIGYGIDVEPNDIDVSDTVTAIWIMR